MTRQTAFLNLSLVYLLLFVSGTWRYNLSPDKFLILTFLLTFAIWLLFSDRKVADRFLLYLAVFCTLLIALYLYTGGSLTLASIVSSTMKLVLAYLVIRTVGERFVETYIKVIVFLAVFSLFGYLTDQFGLFDGIVRRLPRVGAMGYEGFFYLYRFPWHIERNNSIFYEPGAYQGFLNAGLFILFFVETQFSRKRKLVYVFILATALITTFSTTGLLIFAVMTGLFLYRSELVSTAGKIKIVGILAVVVSVFAGQFYSAVVVKVDDYLTADEYEQGSSGKTRSSHAKTDLKIFKEHVFGVGHKKYREAFGVLGRTGLSEATSSNGVTKTLALFGLPFSLFIFGSFFWAMKRMLNDIILSTAAFGMLVMFLAGESYYMPSPIVFAIIAGAFVFRAVPLQAKLQTI